MFRKLRGQEAIDLIKEQLDAHASGIWNHLSKFEAKSAISSSMETLRGIEELINLPMFGLDDQSLEDAVVNLRMDPIDWDTLNHVCKDLEAAFGKKFTQRFVRTLVQASSLRSAFLLRGFFEPAGGLQSVKHAIGYFQSRRRHLVAMIYCLQKACKGTDSMRVLEVINELLPQIEHSGMTISGLYEKLMLSSVHSDFELTVDARGFYASHSYDTLDDLFLEPERTSILDMQSVLKGTDIEDQLEVVSPRLIFSTAEVRNNIMLLEKAYEEFNLAGNFDFSTTVDFVKLCLSQCSDEYNIILTEAQFFALAERAKLKSAVRAKLINTGGDYAQSLDSYAPFVRSDQEFITTVTLLNRFIYQFKNTCLNRIRRYQIRSGFIFEDQVKSALSKQGFRVTDIKRVNRKEFDVVTVMDGTIYNIQCKNNLVDLGSLKTNPRLFARYNRQLDRNYAKALLKEEEREHLLQEKLGLHAIKHFVLSRFPVATKNPYVVAFNQIGEFRRLATTVKSS